MGNAFEKASLSETGTRKRLARASDAFSRAHPAACGNEASGRNAAFQEQPHKTYQHLNIVNKLLKDVMASMTSSIFLDYRKEEIEGVR